jgi:hypothetical protein
VSRNRLVRVALLLALLGGAAYLAVRGDFGRLGKPPAPPPDPTAVTVECVNDTGQPIGLDYRWESAAGAAQGHGKANVADRPGVRQPVGTIAGAAVITSVVVRRGEAVNESKPAARVAAGQVYVITVGADGAVRGEVTGR